MIYFFILIIHSAISEVWEVVSVLSSMPNPRSGHSLTSYNNSLYLFGGCDFESTCYNEIQKYSISSKLWSTLSTSGTSPSAREGHISILLGHYLYIHGGSSQTSLYSDVFRFNLLTNEWSEVSVSGSSVSRAYHGAVLHEHGLILIFGGYTSEGTSAETLILDTINKHWGYPAVVGIKPEARKLHSLSRVQSKVWMFGGETNDAVVNELWYFDLKVRKWFQWKGGNSAVPTSRHGHRTLSYGSKIYLFGGCNNDQRKCFRDTWVFDINSETWTKLDDSESIKPREAFGIDFIAGKMYLFAGRYLMEKEYGDFWMFDTDEPCPEKCSGHGSCGDSGCKCDAGYSGNDCSTKTACRLECNEHGICDNYECVCYPGYYGTYCQGLVGCPNNCTSATHGKCQDSAECLCYSGYTGEDCSLREDWKLCEDLCIHGICKDLDCSCSQGWVGTYCDVKEPVIYYPASSSTSSSASTKVSTSSSGESENLNNSTIEADSLTYEEAAKTQDEAAESFKKETSLHYLIPEMFGFVDAADPTLFFAKNLRRIPEEHVKEEWIAAYESSIENREDEIAACELYCSFHGTCYASTCYCEHGYTGDLCEIKEDDIDKGVKLDTAAIIIVCFSIVGCCFGCYNLRKIMKQIKLREESKVEQKDDDDQDS